jgi:hypothetical protein
MMFEPIWVFLVAADNGLPEIAVSDVLWEVRALKRGIRFGGAVLTGHHVSNPIDLSHAVLKLVLLASWQYVLRALVILSDIRCGDR